MPKSPSKRLATGLLLCGLLFFAWLTSGSSQADANVGRFEDAGECVGQDGSGAVSMARVFASTGSAHEAERTQTLPIDLESPSFDEDEQGDIAVVWDSATRSGGDPDAI